jgi:hypothetical protein
MVVIAIGWLGAGALLLAYGLVLRQRIEGTGGVFQALNIAGGAGLATSSAVAAAWPSAVLNVIWVGVGVGSLLCKSQARHEPAS